MQTRYARLLELLNTIGLDACWIVNPENIRYLSGFTGEGSLLMAGDELFIMTDGRFTEQAEHECPDFEVLRTSLAVRAPAVIQAVLKKRHILQVGFEPDALSVADYNDARTELHSVEMCAMRRPVEQLRRVKDDAEIAFIQMAADIACEAFDQMLKIIVPGMTERSIQQQLDYTMLKLGSEMVAFPTIACSGPNGSLPHATPSDRSIQQGELLTLDFGAQVQGYKCDITRTIAIGKISNQLKDIFETVYQAQCAAFDILKPGVACADVDRVARDLIDMKYPNMFAHSLGHGVGLNIHETPNFSQRAKDILSPGHVVTVEPGIYIPRMAGCRIEDMAIITKNGYINPITVKRELITI